MEPGVIGGAGLESDAPAAARFVSSQIMPRLAPHMKYLSTTDRVAEVMVNVLTQESGTGGYFDEESRPMYPSAQVQEPGFGDRVVAQTRELLTQRG